MAGIGFGQRRKTFVDPKAKIDKNTIINVIKYTSKYKFRLLLVVICFLFSTAVSVQTGLYLGELIDNHIMRLLKEQAEGLTLNFKPFFSSLVHYIILLLLGVVSNFLYQVIMAYIGQGQLRDIREAMFTHMETLPLSYFDNNGTGDVMARYTSDLDTLRQSISGAAPQAMAAITTIVVLFISMLSLSVNLTILVIVVCIVMIIITRRASKISLHSNIKAQQAVGDLNSYVEEMVNGAKEVKLFCFEKRNIDKFTDKNIYWKENVLLGDTISNILMPINNGFGNILYILIALIGGYLAINQMPNFYCFGTNILTLGTIATFLTFTKNVVQEIANVSNQIPSIIQSMSGSKRIFDLFEVKPEVDEGNVILTHGKFENGKIVETTNEKDKLYWKDEDKLIEFKGDIILTNVDFSYEEGKPILNNINIYANFGQKVALVGKTGAGKTTITNLLNRFYEIEKGTITYDGIDIKRIKKKDLRKSLGLVLQDVNLFSGTILDNIRYGNLNATDEECKNAAKETHATEFIEQLEKGFDTLIGGDSGGLSQGQKQLLSIARCHVANPPVMILDEATSSIDTRTEKLVQDGTDRIMKGRTVFVIAHRLSTIKNSDVIMVMDNGQIIERGNHEQLMEKKGRYYELYTGKVELD